MIKNLTLLACSSLIMICLGVQVAEGQVRFSDVSSGRGILPNQLEAGFGGGVAVFDFDADGDHDIFLPQAFDSPDRLYRNDGDGNFQDIASQVGLEVNLAGRNALWLDYDDDHLVDLLITSDCFNSTNPDCTTTTSVRLYRQTESGQFQNVTQEAGLDNSGIQEFFGHRSSLTCGDVDRDGDLDLLIGQWEGQLQLFINESGTFVDQTLARGIINPNAPLPSNPWQSVMHDFDGDGWIDIYTAVDFFPNQLWHNQGDGTFVNVAESSGSDFAFNDMGVTLGDYDNDGDFDIYVTNIFENDRFNLLLQNRSTPGNIQFAEVSAQARVNNTGFGWGATFFDADNDTDLDLAVTNGWFNGVGFDDVSKVFLNPGGENPVFVDATKGSGFNDNFFGSCLVSADLNRDGDLDLLQVCNPALLAGPFRILENQTNETNPTNWLVVRPRQAHKNHWSIGAIVTVEMGDLTISRTIQTGTSIHGQEPAEAVFGLGAATSVDRVTVRWPQGGETVWENVGAQQIFDARDTDLNRDGNLSLLDIFPFQQMVGDCDTDCQADFNHDGTVDVEDAMIFISSLQRQ